ncbi:alpha/beta-hydrolase [Tilletiaria anomala UBC 951]|uniref:Palmitoyl-protein thioesterase 1 n=1 Tax=Tilletiaria anomala (strain ATCC 24038 / CBS 436.72 / UBC 951) TaxID=1037660 RepID=A0A066VAY9_TILAU|nr:alpha/beta-hydrolase [Tilletiaria anomala UBC 951]KDN38646.1 alpha/beta-hydrolase [Tilletiaria anomala UBC 951]
MMYPSRGLLVRCATMLALTTAQLARAASLFSSRPVPVVLWHGLGDSAYSEGMQSLADSLREAFPGLFVHLVALEDRARADQKAGVFGNVNDQVQQVCEQLASIKELKDGFDGIGFSQGGQFLRAYVERCNKPAMRNLVTFGSQHMGIADLPACSPADIFCRLAEGLLRGGIYTDYAQNNVVSAQYYRNPKDPRAFQNYQEKNHFLADINNELQVNQTYIKNLKSLDNFVMLMFDKDITVEPKRSSWFSSYPVANGMNDSAHKDPRNQPLPLRQSPIYLEDRLGLKKMDKRGALVFETCHGPHMRIDSACQLKVFGKWIGTPASVLPRPVRHAWAYVNWNLLGVQVGSLPAVIQLTLFSWLLLSMLVLSRLAAVAVLKVGRTLHVPRRGKIALS